MNVFKWMLIYSRVFKLSLIWSHTATIMVLALLSHMSGLSILKNMNEWQVNLCRHCAQQNNWKGERPMDPEILVLHFQNSIYIFLESRVRVWWLGLVCGFVAGLKLASSRIRPLTKYWQSAEAGQKPHHHGFTQIYNFPVKSCVEKERHRLREALGVMMSFWPQLVAILSSTECNFCRWQKRGVGSVFIIYLALKDTGRGKWLWSGPILSESRSQFPLWHHKTRKISRHISRSTYPFTSSEYQMHAGRYRWFKSYGRESISKRNLKSLSTNVIWQFLRESPHTGRPCNLIFSASVLRPIGWITLLGVCES